MPLRSSLLLLPRLPYVGQTLSVVSCCHADIHMSQNSYECWSIFGPRPAARPKKCTCAACANFWPHRQLSMRDWRTCRGDYKVIPPAPGAFRVIRWPIHFRKFHMRRMWNFSEQFHMRRMWNFLDFGPCWRTNSAPHPENHENS